MCFSIGLQRKKVYLKNIHCRNSHIVMYNKISKISTKQKSIFSFEQNIWKSSRIYNHGSLYNYGTSVNPEWFYSDKHTSNYFLKDAIENGVGAKFCLLGNNMSYLTIIFYFKKLTQKIISFLTAKIWLIFTIAHSNKFNFGWIQLNFKAQ